MVVLIISDFRGLHTEHIPYTLEVFPSLGSGSWSSRRLFAGLCCRNSLLKVKMGFGVGELLDLDDLQASIFVGYDLCDEDHFANHFHPDRGVRLGGKLWGWMLSWDARSRSERLNANMNDDLSRNFYDGMEDHL